MKNSNSVGVADKTPMDRLLLQKHRYVFKVDGHGNHETMHVDDFQPHGRGRRGDNRCGGFIQVIGTAAGPFRQRLAGGQAEYLEGEAYL